jgi:restriction system protein
VLTAIWFVWNYFKSGKLRKKALGMSAKDLLDLPPGEFEEMTAELYRARGFQANKTGATGDHGVDVVVKSKDGKTMIVQCKRWRKPVGEPIIREFYGTMHHEKAAHGTIIATSGFTPQAIEWAKGKPMSLYDGNKFVEMWQNSKKQKSLAQQKGGYR